MPIERHLGSGSRSEYTPYNLSRNYTEDQLRSEYRRLRRSLQSRVRYIEKSGEFPDSSAAKTLSRFSAPSTYDKTQLSLKLSELENILNKDTTTLTGLRAAEREVIETLQDRGFSNIDRSNIRNFTRFMESTRSLAYSIMQYKVSKAGIASGPDKKTRLEIFNTAQRKGITTNALIRDFRYFYTHKDELSQLPDRPTGRRIGIKTVKRLLS